MTRTFIVCFECCEIREFSGSRKPKAYVSYVVDPRLQILFDGILAASDITYLRKTKIKRIAATGYIKIGEEITEHNSRMAEQWTDETKGDEISLIDYSHHPKAKKFITGDYFLRPSDFEYTSTDKK